MDNQQKSSLFRDKSLNAIESPEALNDYLRVTSPGVWLIMAAVIAVLLGLILWSVFGRIDTSVQVAVFASEDRTICYVPYDTLQKLGEGKTVKVEGSDYVLDLSGATDVVIVTEEISPYIRVTGKLDVGDLTVAVPVRAALADGVYPGTVITESLQPITLLLK